MNTVQPFTVFFAQAVTIRAGLTYLRHDSKGRIGVFAKDSGDAIAQFRAMPESAGMTVYRVRQDA